MGIRVLGPVSLDGGPQLSRRDRIVLSALVLERPKAVSRDRLELLVWPDGAPATSTKVIQGCVARLRGRLDQRWIMTTDHGYRLEQTGDLDMTAFERGVARGRELLQMDQPDRAKHVLGDALALWRGVPFEELEDWDVAAIETARLRELRLQGEELRVDAMLASGRPEEAAAEATVLVELEPLREHRWQQLALAQVRCDRQSDALETLRRCRAMLSGELGLDPGAALGDLERAVLRQDPSLVSATDPVTTTDTCPWPGLESYDASGSDGFFGRESELVSALAILHGRDVLVVVGPSGVGKSSFVLAGLVPALQREGRRVRVTTPASSTDLRADSDVLVADQCEELFAAGVTPRTREEFLAALADRARQGLVVVCLRADRMVEVATNRALAELVERGLFLLQPMSPEGLRAAIEQPAARAGLLVEPGLVEVLLGDLEDEPGVLPLLSHALVGTWERREGRTLTVTGYRASGGVRGAVSQTAERLYVDLGAREQHWLRALMLRLVSSTSEGEPLRARVPRELLAPDPGRSALVEELVTSRLLTSDEGSVTLAHEVLVRAWPRLRGWIEDDAEGRRMLHHLADSAAAWDALGRPESELYRGIRLARAAEWKDATGVDLAPVERAFLDTSQDRARAEERSARDQIRRQHQVNRRLRVLVAAVAAVAVAAAAAGGWALHQNQVAGHAATAADARRVGAAALLQQAPEQSLRMAVAGARLSPSRDTGQNLHAALAARPLLERTTSLPVASTLSWALATPSGLLVTDRTHGLHLLSTTGLVEKTAAQVGGTEGDNWDVPLGSSPQQHVVAVASQQPDPLPIRLFDPTALTLDPHQLDGWPDRPVGVMSIAVSGNGRYLAAGMTANDIRSQTDGLIDDGRVFVWDLHTRHVVARFPIAKVWLGGVALDHSGRRLYLTNPLTAYDVRSGRRLWHAAGAGFTLSIAASPGGGIVAAPDPADDRTVDVRDDRDGRVLLSLQGHQDAVTSVAFSHDGTRIAASGRDGLVLVWDATTGEELDRITVGGAEVIGVTFAPDDRSVFTTAEPDHQVSQWDLSGRHTYVTRIPVTWPSEVGNGNARVSADGSRVATTTQTDHGPVMKIVDVEQDTTTRVRTPDLTSFGAMSWAPDGSALAFGWSHGTVEVVDGHTGRRIAQRRVLHGMLTEVSHSHDGRHLVAVDTSGGVVRLDPTTLDVTGDPVRLPEKPYAVAASPDGRYAFVIAGGTRWMPYWDVPIDHFYLVDLETGRIVRNGSAGVRNAVYCDFSPDGRHVTIGGRNGQVVVMDVTTGKPVNPAVDVYSGDTFSVRYNPSGSLVTVASTTSQLAVLDGRTGELVATASLPTSERAVVSNFAPDGTVLAASFAGHVFRWDPSTEHAVAFACRITGSGLGRSEWQSLLPDESWRRTCPA